MKKIYDLVTVILPQMGSQMDCMDGGMHGGRIFHTPPSPTNVGLGTIKGHVKIIHGSESTCTYCIYIPGK